jgi:hypothetical protein
MTKNERHWTAEEKLVRGVTPADREEATSARTALSSGSLSLG